MGRATIISTRRGLPGFIEEEAQAARSIAEREASERIRTSIVEQGISEKQAQELELQAQTERTRAALEEADRQRKLTVLLASQRARFSGGGIDPDSGSLLRIQQATIGATQRQDREAGLFSLLKVGSINRQATSRLLAGLESLNAGIFGSTQILARSELSISKFIRIETEQAQNKQRRELAGLVAAASSIRSRRDRKRAARKARRANRVDPLSFATKAEKRTAFNQSLSRGFSVKTSKTSSFIRTSL